VRTAPVPEAIAAVPSAHGAAHATAQPGVPDVSAAKEQTLENWAAVEARVAHLFRHAGNDALTQELRLALVEYRLEQRS
jgi:hypothetical protein